ncbi:MAG: heavy metal translocating P-type ATPase [Clostridia bacterium]
MKKKFSIKGMSCSSCQAHVQKAVEKLDGVKSCNVNLINNTMDVETDKLTDTDIIKAVIDVGYGAEVFTQLKYEKKSNIDKIRLIVSSVFLVILLYISMGSMVGLPLPYFLVGKSNAVNFGLAQVIMLIPIIILNFSYFTSGYKKLFKGKPNMDTLVALGSTAAIIYGIFAIIRMQYGINIGDDVLVNKYHMELYFESAGTILTLVTIGKYIESNSKSKTGDALKLLMNLSGKVATKIVNGIEIEISVDEIKQNDIIKVTSGMNIGVDGVIVNGGANIDEASMTGESIPKYKTIGDNVIGGTINVDGVIHYKATSTSKNSTIAKIIEMVEDASNSKAPIAKIVDKISSIFVPSVMIISAIAFTIWMLVTKDLEFSLGIGIAVLVISCPCALGLATPIVIMISTAIAAKNRILIKDAAALEKLHLVDTIVMDKTGTITKGLLNVNKIASYDDKFLMVLGSLENQSKHPIAQAVNRYIIEKGVSVMAVTDFKNEAGKGVEGIINGEKYYCGNLKYISEHIKIKENYDFGTFSVLMVASTTKLLGYATISDTIKQTSIEAIHAFKHKGIKTYMLTGDNNASAEYVKEIVGVDEVVSEVMPSQKAEFIKKLQNEGKNVLMIGDGINDSVALETANVAMAIGAGSDIAIESADIVLVGNDLMDAVRAIKISKKSLTIIKMNLFWAFFYNIISIPIAAGVLYPFFHIKLNPIIAAAAMSISSICVVLNSLRLRNVLKNNDKNKLII